MKSHLQNPKAIKSFMIMAVCAVVFCHCKKSDEDIMMTVASRKSSCYVVEKSSCYIVRIGNSPDWLTIADYINGFEYEPGFEYVIKVQEKRINNPPEDYRGEYILKEIVSKEKKDSENLPPDPEW